MTDRKEIERLIQSHKALDPFDYKIAVDWAVDLIREGNESDNILMLAAFFEPIDNNEIKPYVSAVLNELELEELKCEDALIAQTHFLLAQILRGENIRENLKGLGNVCMANDFDKRIMDFYLLYHSWWDLDEIGENYYYEGVDIKNIEVVLKLEAKIWIDKYIFDEENVELLQELKKEKNKTSLRIKNKSNGSKSQKITQPTSIKRQSWWKRLWS